MTRIKDRFTGVGNKLSDEERAQVREMEARYGKRHVEWPFPRSTREPSKIEQRFPNEGRQLFESEKPVVEEFNKKYEAKLMDAATTKERRAVIAYLVEKGHPALADHIAAGLHHVR